MSKDSKLVPGQQVKVPDTPEPASHKGSDAQKFAQAIDSDDDIGKIATGRLDPKTIKSRTPSHPKTKVDIPQGQGSVPWQDIAHYCKSKWKMSREQIAGILANIKVESQFFANDLHMDSNGLPAGGLFSHNGQIGRAHV